MPTVRVIFPTTNPKSLERMRRASLLSRAFRLGDRDAQMRLHQRHCCYLSLSTGMPWPERLALANAARARNIAARKLEKERTAVEERLQRELDQTR